METNQAQSKCILTEKQKRYLPVKRAIDLILSGVAIIVLSPVLAGIAIAIKVDSSGSVLFKQKRVGKNKEMFEILKFRTMCSDAPKDIPTHRLENPDQYITKMGKFMRATSLDELPQIFNIFRGQMSVIGPRPALWNQIDLVVERDKYGANEIVPGLTGWAQINGRDELKIPIKAKFDGAYVKKMGFGMDIKCFLGTIGAVLSHTGIVEGGVDRMHKEDDSTTRIVVAKIKKQIQIGVAVVGVISGVMIGCSSLLFKYFKHQEICICDSKPKRGLLKKFFALAVVAEGVAIIYSNIKRKVQLADNFVANVDNSEATKKSTDVENNQSYTEPYVTQKILITGASSYIGTSVAAWLTRSPDVYTVDTLDMYDEDWKNKDFSAYDVVYHVAGIAHADICAVSEEQEQLYYKVNTDLAVEVAEKAKDSGVKQFIFMSSMIVYSGCKEKLITSATIPKPLNFYGDSKWQADQKIRELSDADFKVVVLRPPMIYGKGSKGNYPELAKLASRIPVFPIVKNKRSMLHIDNLCEFIKAMIDNGESGVFFPQNREYTNTSDMVQMIADVKGHKIIMIPVTSFAIKMAGKIPGRLGTLVNKVFGDSAYEMSMSEYKEEYRIRTQRESIKLTEANDEKGFNVGVGSINDRSV